MRTLSLNSRSAVESIAMMTFICRQPSGEIELMTRHAIGCESAEQTMTDTQLALKVLATKSN